MGRNPDDAENDRLIDWAGSNEGQEVTGSLMRITENNGRKEGEGGSEGEEGANGGRIELDWSEVVGGGAAADWERLVAKLGRSLSLSLFLSID